MQALLAVLISTLLLSPGAFAAGAEEAASAKQEEAGPRLDPIAPDALTALLAEAPGRVRVVNFWATWCGPCVAELPLLRQFAADHPGVEVVLVNVDQPSLRDRKVIPFLKKYELQGLRNVQLEHPDPAMALIQAVPDWPDSIPVTLVFRADGARALLLNRGLSEGELESAVAAAKAASEAPRAGR